MSYSLQLTNPARRLLGERRVKLLDAQSPLVRRLEAIRRRFERHFAILLAEQEPWHIELVSPAESPSDAMLARRAAAVHGHEIDTRNTGMIGKSFVVWGPDVEGFGTTHITLATFHPPPERVLQELAREP